MSFKKNLSGLPLISAYLYILSLISVQVIKGAHQGSLERERRMEVCAWIWDEMEK